LVIDTIQRSQGVDSIGNEQGPETRALLRQLTGIDVEPRR